MPGAESALQQQLSSLYRSHHGWLHGWLRKKLGCGHHAADVAHDTFLRIVASRDALLGMREPRAFLTTTAKRLLIDQARRQNIEQAYLAELAALADRLPGYPSPEEILLAVQALQQIGAALEGLPGKPREAFLLHYLEGMSQAEVAAALGVSARMVHKHLVKALLHCRHACPALDGAAS
ncbi:sigma-70 family RNA polymerase sigma factor [Herbaspirillum sp. WKF16]|jgi:RNA polymerase sigma-70 factor (ECF subfamily)|uniref:sigma-70 family RNA polymerase sigma factor n=1 Tax=Herbaspirillum sp. WKF16 TaxID=3028312 RepID=UPI0023AA0CEB|nr:sigma-70 family RNA polymerase sigma factor [Herbaspirillum sp. WKF16]WDZ98214.1 sigma-70 family RNA polymerase sigma factor [Herbaspirillum sp. WKF16]